MFFNEDYALMRHARDNQRTGKIPQDEQEICRKVIRLLAEKIAGKKVKIFHSHLNRAKLTGELVKSELIALGFPVDDCAPLDWLYDNLSKIPSVLADNNNFFVIFICHQPGIEDYISYFGNVGNCSIFSKNFKISRQEAIEHQ